MNVPLAIAEGCVARFVSWHHDHPLIPVRFAAGGGRCAGCVHATQSIHCRYHCHTADLPLSTSQTKLRVEVRRFYCLNPTCRGRIFADTPADVLALRARRTWRLCEARGPGPASPMGVRAVHISWRNVTSLGGGKLLLASPCHGAVADRDAQACELRNVPGAAASRYRLYDTVVLVYHPIGSLS